MKYKKIIFLIILGWLFFIFLFSNQTGGESSGLSNKIVFFLQQFSIPKMVPYLIDYSFLIRKAAHFTEYMILGIFFFYFWKSDRLSWKKIFLLSIISCFLLASIDEFHQLFIPGRTGKIFDVLVDTMGAFTSISLLITCHKKKV